MHNHHKLPCMPASCNMLMNPETATATATGLDNGLMTCRKESLWDRLGTNDNNNCEAPISIYILYICCGNASPISGLLYNSFISHFDSQASYVGLETQPALQDPVKPLASKDISRERLGITSSPFLFFSRTSSKAKHVDMFIHTLILHRFRFINVQTSQHCCG